MTAPMFPVETLKISLYKSICVYCFVEANWEQDPNWEPTDDEIRIFLADTIIESQNEEPNIIAALQDWTLDGVKESIKSTKQLMEVFKGL